jgi:hypothetical protein
LITWLENHPGIVEPIALLDKAGVRHLYVKNYQGLHVPIETMTLQDLNRAGIAEDARGQQ